MNKLFPTILLSLSLPLIAAVETEKFPAGDLKTLEVENGSGEITISVSKDADAHVSADKVNFGSGCKLTMRKEGSELEAKVKERFGKDCKVNFDIKVPQATDLKIKLGYGDLMVKGTKGEIEAKVGSGQIKAEGEIRELDAKIGNGPIEVSGLQGDADVKSGHGDVILKYTSTEPKGELELQTGKGNAMVYLPSSAKISTRLKAGLGQVQNELGETAGAPLKVTMKAGAGNLTIKKTN